MYITKSYEKVTNGLYRNLLDDSITDWKVRLHNALPIYDKILELL